MMIMQNGTDFDVETADSTIDCVRIPPAPIDNASYLISLDPALHLTPDRCSLTAKKSVRFQNPGKGPKVRRQLKDGKENVLASIELPADERPKNKKTFLRTKNSNVKVKREGRRSPNHGTTEYEANLEIPELHSTLTLGRNILAVQNMELDVMTALKNRLVVSDKDRIQVKQKSYAKLNEPMEKSEFGQNVVLEVHSDVVVSPAERKLQQSAKSIPVAAGSSREADPNRPSLSRFYDHKLVYTNSLSLDIHGYEPGCLRIRRPDINFSNNSHRLVNRNLSYHQRPS